MLFEELLSTSVAAARADPADPRPRPRRGLGDRRRRRARPRLALKAGRPPRGWVLSATATATTNGDPRRHHEAARGARLGCSSTTTAATAAARAPRRGGTYRDGQAMPGRGGAARGHPGRVFLMGESLGGGVSHELAVRTRPGRPDHHLHLHQHPRHGARAAQVRAVERLVRTRTTSLAKVPASPCPPHPARHPRRAVPYRMGETLRDASTPPRTSWRARRGPQRPL